MTGGWARTRARAWRHGGRRRSPCANSLKSNVCIDFGCVCFCCGSHAFSTLFRICHDLSCRAICLGVLNLIATGVRPHQHSALSSPLTHQWPPDPRCAPPGGCTSAPPRGCAGACLSTGRTIWSTKSERGHSLGQSTFQAFQNTQRIQTVQMGNPSQEPSHPILPLA